MKVAELFAYLGVVADEKKAKDFFNVLEGGKNILYGLAAMAVGSSVAIGAMLDKSLKGAIALSQFEAQTGLSAQTLQEWQHVGEALGLTADSVTSSVSNLNDKLQMVKLTGEGAAPFSMLGINPLEMRDAWDVLDRLRKIVRAGTVPRQTMTALVRQMGLGGEMIKTLELSMDQFDKRANLRNIVTKDQINAALAYNASLKKLGQTITYLFTKAFAEMAPGAIAMIDSIIGWLEKNRGDIEKTIKGITGLWGILAKELGTTFAAIDTIVNKTVGWKGVFAGIGLALAAMHPGLLVIAGIAAALQEIAALMEKGETWKEMREIFAAGEGGPLSKLYKAGEVPRKEGQVDLQGIIGGYLRMPKEHPLKFSLGSWIKDILGGKEAIPSMPEGGKVGPEIGAVPGETNIYLTQNIQTTADANETARIAVDEFDRKVNIASLQVAA